MIRAVGRWLGYIGLLSLLAVPTFAQSVTVLTNQASARVSFWILSTDGKREAKTIAAGESLTLPTSTPIQIAYRHGNQTATQSLLPDQIQVFSDPTGKLELFTLGPEYPPNLPAFPGLNVEEKPYFTLPVKIFTDENIPLTFEVWKKRVEARIEKASQILERTCLLRLEIVGYSTWRSNPESPDLKTILEDFERQVPILPQALSIGFTAHRNFDGTGGRTELGLARSPFYPRILLREEAPQITEVERLETLLHEIGHFLGAVHTSDQNSIMRSTLKDRRGRISEFSISFDPVNTLAMNFWIREYRRQKEQRLTTLRDDTRQKLLSAYRMIRAIGEQQKKVGFPIAENPNLDIMIRVLERLGTPLSALEESATLPQSPTSSATPSQDYNPEDPLGISPPGATSTPNETQTEALPLPDEKEKQESSPPSASPNPEDPLGIFQTAAPVLVAEPREETTLQRKKLLELKRKWQQNWKVEKITPYTLPAKTTQYVLLSVLLELDADESKEESSDLYTEKLVRLAAAAALEIGGKSSHDTQEGRMARQAFLLAVETMMESSGILQSLPVYGKRFRALETKTLQEFRKKVIRDVSIFGRHDLCQHFWVSAALATHLEPQAVEIIGLEKERNDASRGSGFDVTDLNADLSGVAFACYVMEGKISLEKIAREFEFSHVIPTRIRLSQTLANPETREEEDETMRRLRNAIQEHLKTNYGS